MKKENCMKRKIHLEEKKTKIVPIRITPKISSWLKKEGLSPTGIFYEAIKELGYK